MLANILRLAAIGVVLSSLVGCQTSRKGMFSWAKWPGKDKKADVAANPYAASPSSSYPTLPSQNAQPFMASTTSNSGATPGSMPTGYPTQPPATMASHTSPHSPPPLTAPSPYPPGYGTSNPASASTTPGATGSNMYGSTYPGAPPAAAGSGYPTAMSNTTPPPSAAGARPTVSYGTQPSSYSTAASTTPPSGVRTADARYGETPGVSKYATGSQYDPNSPMAQPVGHLEPGQGYRTAATAAPSSPPSSNYPPARNNPPSGVYPAAATAPAGSGYPPANAATGTSQPTGASRIPSTTRIYEPGNTGYQPGNTGYAPNGTPAYSAPPAYNSPGAATPYRPGSTSSYTPRGNSAVTLASHEEPLPTVSSPPASTRSTTDGGSAPSATPMNVANPNAGRDRYAAPAGSRYADRSPSAYSATPTR